MRHEWDIIPGEAPAAMRNRVALDMSAALGDADALDVLRYGRELFAERMAVEIVGTDKCAAYFGG